MEKVDCVVIGAGVVGLAVARALALDGRHVIILEAESNFGVHTSSRNSEVIHAGLSYQPGSLKARLCRKGRDMLYAYAQERHIPHRRLGKLIVAADDDEIAGLDKYLVLAAANHISDLSLLDQAAIHELEPEVKAVAGLYSPSTGIIDSHSYMLSLLGDAQNAGVTVVYRSPVMGARVAKNAIELDVGSESDMTLNARLVVNCAGLHAHKFAQSLKGMPNEQIPQIHYAIGHYYTLSTQSPFTHLVYPVARNAAARVHVTLDLANGCKFGPDIAWRNEVDYTFDHQSEAAFYEGIRRFWPDLPNGTLVPGYTGIRPRLAGPDSLHNSDTDFIIQDQKTHGVAGLINLFGIESPGLTSSLALGEYVAALVRPR